MLNPALITSTKLKLRLACRGVSWFCCCSAALRRSSVVLVRQPSHLLLRSSTHSNALLLSISRVCLVGNRTLRIDNLEACAKTRTVENVTMSTDLWDVFCQGQYPNATCDSYFLLNDVAEIQAIPGLLSGVIKGERTGWEGDL